MFGHFYNSSIRRYVILMGELFNGIQVKRERADGSTHFIKVPITYSSKEKFMMSLDKHNSLTSETDVAKVETILPRMCLTLVDMMYNQGFKTGQINTSVPRYTAEGVKLMTQYNPVPYKFMFELGVYTRHEDDMFQIVEQILPYFQPHFNCKITELFDKEIPIDRDIKINLMSVTPDERVDSDKISRRRLEWSLMFEFNGWLYPPATETTGEIRTIYLDFHANSKELTDGGYFESVDTQVVQRDADPSEWGGKYEQTYSNDIPIPSDPLPPNPRK